LVFSTCVDPLSKYFRRFTFVLVFALVALQLSACASLWFTSPTAETMATVERIDRSLSCDNFPSEFWDALYQHVLTHHKMPAVRQMQAGWMAALGKRSLPLSSSAQAPLLTDGLSELYGNIFKAVSYSNDSDDDSLGALVALELHDVRDPERQIMIQKIDDGFQKIHEIIAANPKAFAGVCSKLSDRTVKKPNFTNSLVVRGAEKVFATIYQNCRSLKVAPMELQTPDLRGVKIIGTHPNGIGRMRVVGDREGLVKSHPYLGDSSLKSPVCKDTSQNPPIYNYGGKPYASVSGESESATESFDFFRSSGTGTTALGTDCSGFVFTSLAAAGLKIRAETRSKAVFVNGVSASMFFDPKSSGLTCFDLVEFDRHRNILPGDIIASKGHVVIVESVGKDPFGINQIQSDKDCRLENFPIEKIDFVILQSSPFKGGLGVQKARAAAFFADPDEKAMLDAVLRWAEIACHAKFSRQSLKAQSFGASLVRHSETAPCFDQPIPLEGEACIDSCILTN
jgi:hypothetical protein